MAHVSYTVQPDDRVRGLHGLACWFYGTTERWVELYRSNRAVIGDDPIALRAGQQLVFPYDPDADVLPVALYQVQPADYHRGLSGIALQHYGDPTRAEQLYQINRGVIGDNPNLLQTGQVLILP